jgi:hypothetical protein
MYLGLLLAVFASSGEHQDSFLCAVSLLVEYPKRLFLDLRTMGLLSRSGRRSLGRVMTRHDPEVIMKKNVMRTRKRVMGVERADVLCGE